MSTGDEFDQCGGRLAQSVADDFEARGLVKFISPTAKAMLVDIYGSLIGNALKAVPITGRNQ